MLETKKVFCANVRDQFSKFPYNKWIQVVRMINIINMLIKYYVHIGLSPLKRLMSKSINAIVEL